MKTRAFLLGSPGTRVEWSEVQGDETSTLVLLRDRIEWIRLLQNLCGEILAILFRLVAELLRPGVVPVTTRIVRNPPHCHVADVRDVYALHHQFDQILRAEPCTEMTEFGRWLPHRGADAHRNALDAMLVPVHARHRLAPDLRQAVEAVGTKRGGEVQLGL